MGSSAISGGTPYQPPLPSYRIGNELYSISSRFRMDIVWLVNAYSSHSIHDMGGRGQFKLTKPRGSIYGMQGDGSTIKPGGFMEIAMFGFELAWV